MPDWVELLAFSLVVWLVVSLPAALLIARVLGRLAALENKKDQAERRSIGKRIMAVWPRQQTR
jgi:membrane protein implicated in regulation of membrane protease activity